METEFQLIDCDYVLVDNLPIVRLFGKTSENKTVCAFLDGFLPYFYVLPENKEKTVAFLKENFNNLLVNIEEVEKFLPIGFQTKKTKLLKIILKDPSKVVSIREELREKDFVKDIYEADILFKYRFMADFSLSGMRWVRISGDATNTTTVKTDKKIEAKSVSIVEEDKNVSFKYMGIDIETASEGIPNSRKDKIAMLSLSFFPAFNGYNTLVLVSKPIKKIDRDVFVFKDEKQMLEEFTKILDSFDPDFICGYNINNFDLPFIVDRLRENKISRAIGRCKQKQAICRKIGTRFRNSITGRVIVDVYDLIRESVGKGLLRLKRFGLGDVSKVLLNEDKVDISHSEITKYWNGDEAQVKKLIEYARKDAELVLKLLLGKDMLAKFIELSKVSGLLLQDVLDGGEATRVENLLLREFDKSDYVIPCKPSQKEILRRKDKRQAEGFKGALVLEPEIGLHTTNVIYLDFACHPGDTLVVIKGKGKVGVSDVKEGDYILGKNGWHRVKKVWSYDYKGTLIDVNGLKCTPNHRIPVLKKNRNQYFVKDVFALPMAQGKVNGEIIKCNIFDEVSSFENGKKEEILKGELLGILLAEGYLLKKNAKYFDKKRGRERISHQHRVDISINSEEEDFKNRIKYIFEKLFGACPYEIKPKGRNVLHIQISKKRIYYNIIKTLKEIKKCDARAVVRGFFEGDGTVNLPRRTIVMNQSGKNRKKLEFISQLLNKLKIGYKWYEFQKKRCIIEIARRDDIAKFATLVGAISKEKQKKLEMILERKNFKVTGRFYKPESIRVSTSYFNGKVYDLTLEGEPYYFANGILTHNSMYPSIFVAWNICPTTLLLERKKVEAINTPYGTKFVSPKIKEGIIPKIVSLLVKQRDKIKKQMEKADKTKIKVLNARQYALKIMANAFYGYTGYLRARFYVLGIANAITSCGRELLQKTKKIVESDERFKVIYGDTDSLLVKLQTTDLEKAFKLGEEVEKRINEELKEIVRIKIENVFKTMLILTKKRYVGWSFEKVNGSWEDRFVMKGIETVRRDWCGLVEETLFKTLEIILKEQDTKKAFDYVKGILNKLEKNEIPIEKLVITKGISKPLREYKGIQPHIELVKKLRKRAPASAPGIGDRVEFVIIQGPQLISDRAEDPEYVKERKLKIDSRYYIESQLLPPLERVFEAIGISKSELIGIGRQLLLTDAIKAKKEQAISSIEGFICAKCEKEFRRVPLIGKCDCGGEILFYSGGMRSRYFES